MKVLAFVSKYFTLCSGAFTFKRLTRFTVISTIVLASAMAGFTANSSQWFFRRFYGVAALLAPAVYVTTYTVFILGVVFIRIKLRFDLGFFACAWF